MNSPLQHRPSLERLIDLTDTMVAHAQAGDWDAVTRMNQERTRLLTLDTPCEDIGSDTLQQLHRALRSADKRLVRIATEHRDGMAQDGLHQQSRRAAVRGYRDTQTLSSLMSQ